jgi:hypothetical protein
MPSSCNAQAYQTHRIQALLGLCPQLLLLLLELFLTFDLRTLCSQLHWKHTWMLATGMVSSLGKRRLIPGFGRTTILGQC